jgi:hypothetical protein
MPDHNIKSSPGKKKRGATRGKDSESQISRSSSPYKGMLKGK